MIGVRVEPSERAAAQEFFELFKTPWEFEDLDREYDIVISTSDAANLKRSALTLLFAAKATRFDAENAIALQHKSQGAVLVNANRRLPLYGALATFPLGTVGLLREETSREPAIAAVRTERGTIVRVGYNLFREVHFLLTIGQPKANAGIATLEHHVALMRDIITRAGLPLVEIPPVPAGYPFMVCLTHDIDNPIMRNHRWDWTMTGFLYRATLISLVKALSGKIPWQSMLKNWAAALRLPFVYLGLARDTWAGFDAYLEIEAGLGSTYFVICERDMPGRKKDGPAPVKRACRYSLSDIKNQLERIQASGNEIGLHGLDAWLDSKAGAREKERLARFSPVQFLGIRMHWLYSDENSPAILEEVGFAYDSTFGYNDTVGFRAGTAQVYRPLGNRTLMELPLHVMDTALFYPDYLALEESEAHEIVNNLVDRVAESGGALTINWHDRSIFVERLWGTFYFALLEKLKRHRAWFPTASQAVGWFRKRRDASIESVEVVAGRMKVQCKSSLEDLLPGLLVRIHRPSYRGSDELLATTASAGHFDVAYATSLEANLIT